MRMNFGESAGRLRARKTYEINFEISRNPLIREVDLVQERGACFWRPIKSCPT